MLSNCYAIIKVIFLIVKKVLKNYYFIIFLKKNYIYINIYIFVVYIFLKNYFIIYKIFFGFKIFYQKKKKNFFYMIAVLT